MTPERWARNGWVKLPAWLQHYADRRPDDNRCPDCDQVVVGQTVGGDHFVSVDGEWLSGPCPAAGL